MLPVLQTQQATSHIVYVSYVDEYDCNALAIDKFRNVLTSNVLN